MTLADYISTVYLPFVAATLRETTVRHYRSIWRQHGQGSGLAELDMCAISVPDAQGAIERIAEGTRGRRTLGHIKAFYSGVFAHAIRAGIRTDNPWAYVRLPRTTAPDDTYVYSDKEVSSIIAGLDGAARLAVQIAAWTGLRRAEIEGLQWGDWEGDRLLIRRSWQLGRYEETKTRASRAVVVVPDRLRTALGWARSAAGAAGDLQSLPVLASALGTPLNLNNLASRAIRPRLGPTWHGWQAFRRFHASRLYAAGTPDLVIARALRHSSTAVSREFYVRTDFDQVQDAVKRLG